MKRCSFELLASQAYLDIHFKKERMHNQYDAPWSLDPDHPGIATCALTCSPPNFGRSPSCSSYRLLMLALASIAVIAVFFVRGGRQRGGKATDQTPTESSTESATDLEAVLGV